MKSNELIHLGSRKNIPPDRILMLKSDTNYTIIYLDDGSRILSSTTLGIIEKRLEGFDFFRTHRSTIINLRFVSNYERIKQTSELLRIFLKNKEEVPLSRRKTIAFLKIME
ncbi:LytTR family transcriptional regulator [Lacihabitans sp. CCS-44]|uniref:LytR/AlgR family response regulator transcription factor n=1 Tax=Lacihabitans sp. CCS-44 TaxID=2487331 RepID=UPI0020CC8965|nr:LytTR family DNA-binding domain-containing protein [Lacihabitans sp. CCS-44]MCP9757103.1 LytTR family transcriptional regulator [Lacihabitans sp. CCS-44]